jgi:hypothetical protein
MSAMEGFSLPVQASNPIAILSYTPTRAAIPTYVLAFTFC